MKILVHVGLHRAASTSLQRWLNGHRTEWEAANRFVHAGLSGASSGSPFAVLVGQHLRNMGPDAAAAFLSARLEETHHRYASGVVSDENLIGPMPGSGTPFQGAEPLAAVFEALSEVHEIVPVVILREHVAWLHSIHHTQQLRGETRNFADFFHSLPAARLNFGPMLDRLSGSGARRMIVASLEGLAADGGRGLQHSILAELGLPEHGATGLPVVNAGREPLLRAITSRLGAHRTMLADLGGPDMGPLLARAQRPEAVPAVTEGLTRLLAERAVRVDWSLSPGQRAASASQAFRAGLEPGQRLEPDTCRAIVAAALAMSFDALSDAEPADLPRAAFAADRARVAARYLPEWSATAS